MATQKKSAVRRTPESELARYLHTLKHKICVSGAAATGHCAPDAFEKAEALGREIARHGLVLVTGATTGMPYYAAKGAKEAGGIVIGFSPAASKLAHVKAYRLPLEYHDLIVYTGSDYTGRDLQLTRAADAVIAVCGRIGTLHEFSIAFEERKPLGILEGSGGTADMIREIIQRADQSAPHVAYSTDPGALVDAVVGMIEADEKRHGLKGRVL